MNYYSNRVLTDPDTGNRVIFGSRNINDIITIPEDPLLIKGPVNLNYCNYGYCDELFLDDYLEGALNIPCYVGSGICYDPHKCGLNTFFKYTRALTHRDEYFKNSIDLKKKHICVIWDIHPSKNVTLAIENYELILRRSAGMEFSKFGTMVWDEESLMNKKFVFDIYGQKWRDMCDLYGIRI